MRLFSIFVCSLVISTLVMRGSVAAEPVVVPLWSGKPPGPPAMTNGPERDFQKPEDRLVGGATVMKLGNVERPEVHVFLAPKNKANGAACVVCPGGGFSILAWDLEGTEVAEWLNSIGVAAIVLKYRVPTRQHDADGKWQGPVMDAQRALSLTRSRAKEWGLDVDRVGILGFSAGGETAARTAVKHGSRLYEAIDPVDKSTCRADFAILVYPGGITDLEGKLREEYAVTKETPPMFFVHAADDRVKAEGSVELFLALKKAGVPSELHVYRDGGHGYGLRPDTARVTRWPSDARAWLDELDLLKSDRPDNSTPGKQP